MRARAERIKMAEPKKKPASQDAGFYLFLFDADTKSGNRLGAGGNKSRAAILRPAIFRMLPTDRYLLTVTDCRQAVRRDSEGGEIIHRGLSALGAERHVVFRSAALVAVTFDLDLGCRVGFEPFRVGF